MKKLLALACVAGGMALLQLSTAHAGGGYYYPSHGGHYSSYGCGYSAPVVIHRPVVVHRPVYHRRPVYRHAYHRPYYSHCGRSRPRASFSFTYVR